MLLVSEDKSIASVNQSFKAKCWNILVLHLY